MRFACISLLAVTCAANAFASSKLAGDWEVVYDCSSATGLFAERCAQGERNSFALHLVVQGKKICGLHASVAQMGNRVDELNGVEPSIEGTVRTDGARVKFQSSFGGTGIATLKSSGKGLTWEILSQDEGTNWLPPKATLLPAKRSNWGAGMVCKDRSAERSAR